MDVRILILIMLVLIVIVQMTSSKFQNVNPRLDDHYNCSENERLIPEGNIPAGSYLGLNKYNIDNLTRKFNVNGDELVNRFMDDH
jgi:hypothetical protein